MRLLTKRLIIFALIAASAAVAVENYAWARTDLDWMLVGYKYQIGQATWNATSWEFNPNWRVPWWDAYMLSVARLVGSAVVLGVCGVGLLWLTVESVKDKVKT